MARRDAVVRHGDGRIEQTIDAANRTANVPKLVLISRIQSLLFEGRLKVHEQIEDAAAFLAELRDFRVEYSASGHMTHNAKAGRHDDMVSVAAVAAWRLSDGAVGWGPPSAELAAMVLGLGGSHPGPAPWAIGLDLGKVHDPTAIVVMRRVSDRVEYGFWPRSYEPIGYLELRALAQAYDIVTLAIETRKDQVEALEWQIKPTDPKESGQGDGRIKDLTKFWRKPDGVHDFAPGCARC